MLGQPPTKGSDLEHREQQYNILDDKGLVLMYLPFSALLWVLLSYYKNLL